jgi:hypothetical protein
MAHQRSGRRWSVAEFEHATGQKVADLAEVVGFDRRTGNRWTQRGWVDDVVADHLACAAGWPAVLVWPGWCDAALAGRQRAGVGS